jgi:integrase
MTRPRGTITKLANGRFQIRIGYIDRYGIRREYKRQGFETKREADNARAEAIVTLGQNKSVEASKQTLEAFLITWYETYKNSRTIKPSTLETTAQHIRAFIVPRIGQLTLRKLNPQSIAKFYADLMSEGRINLNRKNATPELSNKYVRNIAGTLTRALSDAVTWGLLPENPCANARLPKRVKPELNTLGGDQIAQFLNAATQRRDPNLALWLLVFTTGMRRGELAGLRWCDVELLAGSVTIAQTRTVINGQTIIETPKTKAGYRTIALDTLTIKELAKLKDAQEHAATMLGYWSSELVFTDLDGHIPSPNTLLKRFRKALELGGLPKIRLHDARHSYAAYALEQGVSVHIVSPRIGHSSPSFTWDTYAKSIPASDRHAAKIVEDALSKLIDETRSRKGREDAKKDAKIAELDELNYSLRPYKPIPTGLQGHDKQIVWGGRGVSNPRPPGPQPGALTN